jgi:hypothetical protein
MRLAHLLLAGTLVGGLAACAPTISAINARPEKYYQKKVTFRGQITRTQALTGETLLEVADGHGSRILVRATEPVEEVPGDWVRVDGMLVPEARVADRVLYDVVTAERIRRSRAPRFLNLM